MRHYLVLLLFCLCSQLALADQVPVTIWQKETRYRPVSGDTIALQRGSFTLILPIKAKESVSMAAGSGEPPSKLESFGPGRGMAGPYDGLFLTWDAFHYFHIDRSVGDPRMDLWDRKEGLYFWKPQKLYDNTGTSAREMDWAFAPNVTVIVRKDGFEDTSFRVKWVD